jgi:hypothetical protein
MISGRLRADVRGPRQGEDEVADDARRQLTLQRTLTGGPEMVLNNVDAVFVLALDGIAQRLIRHAGEPRRLLTAGSLPCGRQVPQCGGLFFG